LAWTISPKSAEKGTTQFEQDGELKVIIVTGASRAGGRLQVNVVSFTSDDSDYQGVFCPFLRVSTSLSSGMAASVMG
jgi:hypothetical protein